ncbi:MAG: GNAT family protein [Acidimicrobiia bacterium]
MSLALSPASRTTSRLVLRPFKRRDADALSEAIQASLPDLVKWLPWAHRNYDKADAIGYIRESMMAWKEGRAFDFSIRRPDDLKRHLGNISVWPATRGGSVGEIGYWVRSDEASRGICTQAVIRVLETGFEELRFHKITLRIAVDNIGSERVATKIGATQEGVLRDELRIGGVWTDHTLWSILEDEYRAMLPAYRDNGWV